ncbi:MAG: hypothetical protein OXH70_04770 [Acidobacteria bacterium]|nr:hypothetical protein [Acidobacteriota bacterium]
MKKTLTFAAIIAVVFCLAGLPAVGYAQERPDEASMPEVRTVDPHEARQALQRMIHEADDDEIIEMYYGAREAIEKKRALEHKIKKNLRELNEMRQRFEESDRERENPENAAFRLPNSQQPSLFT